LLALLSQPQNLELSAHIFSLQQAKDTGLREHFPQAVGLYQLSLPWCNLNSVLMKKLILRCLPYNTQQIVFLDFVIFPFTCCFGIGFFVQYIIVWLF
jgi:hypothetical protein